MKETRQQLPTKQEDLGIFYLRNINTPEETNAHLVYRASEVLQALSGPQKGFAGRRYSIAKQFYEDTKRILQEKGGLSAEVGAACDRAISDLEKLTGKKI